MGFPRDFPRKTHAIPHSVDTKIKNYACNVCGERFEVRWDLMAHKKNEHPLFLKTCTFFLKGTCAFGYECWFRHTQIGNGSSLPKTLKECKCGLCGNLFERKKVFMEHRKSEHIENVSVCKENKIGDCVYGSQESWFKHHGKKQNGIDDEIRGIKTVDLVKRFFDMMEVLLAEYLKWKIKCIQDKS